MADSQPALEGAPQGLHGVGDIRGDPGGAAAARRARQHRRLLHRALAGLRRNVAAPLQRRTRKWSIYWASNRIDGLEPPVVGSFDNGVGVFEGRQQLDGRPILVRFTWSNITETGARWEQEFSPDEGKTWEKNWIMTMTRELERG